MTTTTTTSFSFQPWARDNEGEGSLKDVLARVNLERGHFRDITEASLQEEIAAEGALELSESESEEEGEDGEDSQDTRRKPATREDLYKAKYEMLAHVRAAEQEILMSLDFVSLLQSRDAAKQASTTISPHLKEAVPMGTLGMDMWQRMPVDRAREAQDEMLAANVRMEGLQQSADDLLAAASRLQNNVRKETQYWSQILTISEEGWNVCRIPGQQHRLGVSYGFSESMEFSRRGIAALNASEDGSIVLERGVGSKPQGLRVVVRKNGNIVGASKLPQVLDAEETTLEARIRYARDSLYDEELYREMIRESRTLASLGVVMQGSAIEIPVDGRASSDSQVQLELVSLDEGQLFNAEASEEEDALAHAIALSARLLLGQAHRDRLKKRFDIPAPLSEKQQDERSVLSILRPIMSFLAHRSALQHLNSYLQTLANVLEAATIQSSLQLARCALPEGANITSWENLVTTLMQTWKSEAQLSINSPKDESIVFTISMQTNLASEFSSAFFLTVPSRTDAYRIDNMQELVAAVDAKIASSLAKALGSTMDEGWECNERESLLFRDHGVDEESEVVRVSLDSGKEMLCLDGGRKKACWRLDGESEEKGLWEAGNDVLQIPK